MTIVTSHIVLVALSLCCAVTTQAQSVTALPDPHDGQAFMKGAAVGMKGGAAAPRLLTRSYYAPQNGVLAPVDSSEMSYAGAIATNVSSQITYKYNNKWYPSSRYNYSYDNSSNNLQTDYQTWSITNNSYQNLVRYNYSFNAANAKTSLLYEIWNTGSNKYVNGLSEVYTLNGRNDVVDMIQQVWSTSVTPNVWTNSVHLIYSYTPSGELQELIQQSWNTAMNNWLNLKRTLYAYDATGKHVASDTSYKWDASLSIWQYSARNIYTLNPAGAPAVATAENYRPRDSSWLSSTEDAYTYNSAGSSLTSTHKLWDDMAASYLNNLNTAYTYNKSGQPTVIDTRTWNGGAWAIGIGSERTTNYYEGDNQLSVITTAGAALDIIVSPVPSTDVLHVSMSGLSQNAEVILVDMRGQVQCIHKLNGLNGQADISVRDIPAGNYVLSVKDNAGASATRIIVIKH